MDSKRRRRMKASICLRKTDLLWSGECPSSESDEPQKSLGMIFDRTAWQKADMLEIGVARSRRE